jgi:hypothetical protein
MQRVKKGMLCPIILGKQNGNALNGTSFNGEIIEETFCILIFTTLMIWFEFKMKE